jgi:hypothetical protein
VSGSHTERLRNYIRRDSKFRWRLTLDLELTSLQKGKGAVLYQEQSRLPLAKLNEAIASGRQVSDRFGSQRHLEPVSLTLFIKRAVRSANDLSSRIPLTLFDLPLASTVIRAGKPASSDTRQLQKRTDESCSP